MCELKDQPGYDARLRVGPNTSTAMGPNRSIVFSYGIYVRSKRRISSITGNEITGPVEVPDVWIPELLRKLGVEPQANSAVRAYNERRTTQVPAWICYEIGSSGLRRKIRIGKGVVKYERNGQLLDLNANSKR